MRKLKLFSLPKQKRLVSLSSHIFIFALSFIISTIFMSFVNGDPLDRLDETFFVIGNFVILFILFFVEGAHRRTESNFSHKVYSMDFHKITLAVLVVLAVLLNGTYYLVSNTEYLEDTTPRPLLVHKVDSYNSDFEQGKEVVKKHRLGKLYGIELSDGNIYLVPKEVWDAVNEKDPIPDYLKDPNKVTQPSSSTK